MQYRPLGRSGIEASVAAFGAWAIGGWMCGGAEEQEAIRAIGVGLDEGMNFIDTAPIYGFGRSEELVGRAIKARREQVVLATKCGLVWDRQEGTVHCYSDRDKITEKPSETTVYRTLRADSIVRELEESLRRLQTDYVDLYQTHWQDAVVPIEETMGALLKLKEQGKIRAIGVSNAQVEHLQQYGQVDADQEKYSMLDRQIERNGQLAYCREHNVAVLAYSPLAQGLLTGAVPAERVFGEGDQRRTKPRFAVENRQRVNRMLAALRPVAQENGATLSQLVIAWTFSQPGLTHVLCGVRRPEQARENAQAGCLRLSDDELRRIDEIIGRYEGEIV